MTFEPKISGTRVTDFEIKGIFIPPVVWLSDAMRTLKHQETMDFLLDEFRFYKGSEEREGDWFTFIDGDTNYKVSILENYPDYEKEMIEYFGEKWLKHYIRFNH